MLEDAARLRLLRSIEARMHAFGSDDDEFAGLDLALVDGADQVEGTGFGGEDDGVGAMRGLSGNASHDQRTEAARVARGEDAVGRQHHQRKRAFEAAQRVGHGVGQRLLARARDQVHDDFGVAGGLEDRSGLLQLRANFEGVDDVAVVRQGDLALVALHHDGLRVQQRRVAGGGVARVTDGKRAGKASQDVGVEDVGDQAHRLVQLQLLAVGRGDARRFLPAMLQGVQAQVSELGRLRMAVDGHHATFFAKLVGCNIHGSPDRRR